MEPFTKKQRKEIYTKAYEVLLNAPKWWGLCAAIYQALEITGFIKLGGRSDLPEMDLFRPKKWRLFWWRKGDKKSRLTALLFMIEMCND